MSIPLVTKLQQGAELTGADEALLRHGIEHVSSAEAGEDLVHDAGPPGVVRLVLEGLACRYKTLRNGRSQIMAFLIPGDFCDLHVSILNAMDHGIRALTACKVAHIPNSTVEVWTHHPRLNRALWWSTLVDEAIMRQWIVSLGARSAEERIAHLFLELLFRLRTVGLVSERSYALPITQTELGDCTGLSNVHVNRILNRLREADLITFQRHRVDIHDIERVTALAGFDPSYLHLKAATSA